MVGMRSVTAAAVLGMFLSGCGSNFLSFQGANTAEDCRTAHSNARMNNNVTGGGSLGRSLIDDTLQRCLSRVAGEGPISTGASIGLQDQAPLRQTVPEPVVAIATPRAPVQTHGFCPPQASVLYGGSSYCVRN